MKHKPLALAVAALTFSSVLQAQEKEEEVLTIGVAPREGDYTFITEDARKLVETAGSLGDPLGAIFSLPGVVYSDNQEPAVRGSSPSDNSYVVDFLPAGYIFHEFGVSIFSEFILHDFQMYSAGFGPEYGAATGAVFDVKLRDPSGDEFRGVVDLSMLRTGLFLEGPVTENSAAYLSVRRSLIDLFIPEEDASDEDEGLDVTKVPRDTDYQAKYAWSFSENNRLSFSLNGATDEAEATFTQEADFVRSNPDFQGDAGIKNEYNGQSILWEAGTLDSDRVRVGLGHIANKEVLFWGDDYRVEVDQDQTTFKAEYTKAWFGQYRMTIGGQYKDYELDYYIDQVLFACTEFDTQCETRRRGRLQDRSIFEYKDSTVYLNNRWTPGSRFVVDLGAQYQHNDFNDDSFVHPRLAVTYHATDKLAFTAKGGSYNRFPDIGTVAPKIGNPSLKSPVSNHYTLGFNYELPREWSVNVETYYKTFDELPRSLNEDEENAELFYTNGTTGEAYGVDILVNKNFTDKWYGWWSLSYGKSKRTNELTDVTDDYHLDTPLIANWVMNYQWTRNFNMGWRWSIRSGEAHTPIVGLQENPYFEDSVLPVYGDPYSERLPFYNRLDLRFKYDFQMISRDASLIVDIINALNYKNVDARILDYDEIDSVDDEVVTKDEEGLGIIPALTLRVNF